MGNTATCIKKKENNGIFPCEHARFMHQVIGLFFQVEQMATRTEAEEGRRQAARARTARPPARVAGEEQPSALPRKGLPSLCTPQLLLKQLLLVGNPLLISH